MKHRSFSSDICGISLMYDALLFVIMVSLAGAILLPLSRPQIALDSSLDKHRQDVVENALHTFLVSRHDLFRYRFSGTLIDDVANSIGINTSSPGLYTSITEWLLAHEQRHKTYETLLAENLGCQFQVPFSLFGTNRLNIFTQDYTRQLQNETKLFFRSLFNEKYRYNITAWWRPIKGISFGGDFSVGPRPPKKDCYVSRSFIMMPYAPVFSFQNHTILFTKHWLRNQLFDSKGVYGASSIPSIEHMMIIFENYTKGISPYDTKENATKAVQENLTVLLYGFLIDGIRNNTNMSVFPGIAHIIVMYGFEKIKNITMGFSEKALDELFGGTIRSIDGLFSSLNKSIVRPVSQTMLAQLNSTIGFLLNTSFSSLSEALDACESYLKHHITILLSDFLTTYIEAFVEYLFDVMTTVTHLTDILIDFLFDRISVNKAEVVLTIWVVRE